MPQFEPSDAEKKWAIDNIKPVLDPALANIKAFERIDIDQNYFNNWEFKKKIQDHFLELGVKLHKLAVFLTAVSPTKTTPHIDGSGDGGARISRFNIPIQGLTGVYVEWWNKDKNSPEVTIREFKEYRNGQLVDAKGLQIKSMLEPSVFKVHNPGSCWNRTELVHRLDLTNLQEQRFVITAQLPNDYQITWKDLIERLYKLKYI